MAMSNAVIHIVEDDAPMREALARLLGALGFEIRVYGSAGEFLLSWPDDSAGCLLLDVHMPGPSGLDLQLALTQRPDAPSVVFLTGVGDIPMSVLALRRGAVDFLTKPVDRDTLVAAVTAAIDRDAGQRADKLARREIRRRFETLTSREKAVFHQVAVGRLNKQIAASLGTCERTVKGHRASVMEKMQVQSLAELVRHAVHLRQDATEDLPTQAAPIGGRGAKYPIAREAAPAGW